MKLIKKVSIVLVCIMLFSFCLPVGVYASTDYGDYVLEEIEDIGEWVRRSIT